jgi:hypothetical protein
MSTEGEGGLALRPIVRSEIHQAEGQLMKQTTGRRTKVKASSRLDLPLAQARALGYFDGKRTVSSRIPAGLLRAAKRKVNAKSNSKLVIVALPLHALEDDFGEQLLRLKGSVDPKVKLEF